MGLFKQLVQTVGENISKDKEQRELEKEFVRNNIGSKAICEYFVNLFDKGNSGYLWIKENKVGVYPVIHSNYVSLCYMQPGTGESLSTIKPKDIEVGKYKFKEMYEWYGIDAGAGYEELTTRTQLNELENMINTEVQKLPHIKYNNGFMVKLFK